MSKKEEIIEKATELFSKKGFENVGIQEIVKSCNVTKPTLYHYFGSKNGLINEIIQVKFLPFLNKLEKTADYKHDITNSINSVVALYFEFAKNQPIIYKLILSSNVLPLESEIQKLLAPYINRQFKILKNMFLQASYDHGNMISRETKYAASFFGAINTYLGMYLNNFSELDTELSNDDIYQLAHQFMHGIFS